MTGLELSRRYYEEVFLPECRKRLPAALGHFAAGLVGEGSECFGFDDELSRDHSFGPRLCIWLTREDCGCFAPDLNALWRGLPDTFMGCRRPDPAANEGQRSGVFSVDGFYRGLLGVPGVPASPLRWLAVEEPRLAAAVNGAVYTDGPGAFTAVRTGLLAYFPPDIIRYHLARHAALAAQTGQYNLLRACRRGETLAARDIRARFIQSAIAMVFLFNRTYRPFYKWAPRAMRALPLLGGEMYDKLLALADTREAGGQIALVEDVCARLLTELRAQGYTAGCSDYLMDHLPEIMEGIEAPEIRDRGISLAQ